MRFALICCAALLVGCGGNGGGSEGGPVALASLAGDWKANYYEIEIDSQGNVTGTTVAPAEPGGNVTATLQADGDVSGTLQVPPGTPKIFTGTWSYDRSSKTLEWIATTDFTTENMDFKRK